MKQYIKDELACYGYEVVNGSIVELPEAKSAPTYTHITGGIFQSTVPFPVPAENGTVIVLIGEKTVAELPVMKVEVSGGRYCYIANICEVADVCGIRLSVPYSELIDAVKLFCSRNNAHFYSRPREDFFCKEGAREAVEAGKNFVVVEDLS